MRNGCDGKNWLLYSRSCLLKVIRGYCTVTRWKKIRSLHDLCDGTVHFFAIYLVTYTSLVVKTAKSLHKCIPNYVKVSIDGRRMSYWEAKVHLTTRIILSVFNLICSHTCFCAQCFSGKPNILNISCYFLILLGRYQTHGLMTVLPGS